MIIICSVLLLRHATSKDSHLQWYFRKTIFKLWMEMENSTEESVLNRNKCLEHGYKLSRQNEGKKF